MTMTNQNNTITDNHHHHHHHHHPSFPPSLLLLADSALPLGSFAFSSGLESYLAHHHQSFPTSTSASTTKDLISTFLSLSLHSLTSTSLPYLIAAYNDPSPARIKVLDNDLDASTTCAVARRASIAQGRALLGVWEKALRDVDATEQSPPSASALQVHNAKTALIAFAALLKTPTQNQNTTPTIPAPNGHLAPLFGLVSLSQALSLRDTLWIFLFNHARSVLSAAVRAGVLGPYQSQAVLASEWLRGIMVSCLQGVDYHGGNDGVEFAAQCVPMLDVWGGRHERLYTRIFNS